MSERDADTLANGGFLYVEEGEYDDLKPAYDFIPGMLCDNTVAIIYGPPGSGKTFYALHLLCCAALGRPVFGETPEKRNGLYIGLEGEANIKARIQAWCVQNREKSNPIDYRLGPFHLADENAVDRLIERMQAREIRFVVIDTLSIASAGMDEISGAVMTEIVNVLHRIKRETGACVAALAHTGKNEKAGIRGHSSQLGNVDTTIELVVHNKETVTAGGKSRVIEHEVTLRTPRSANVRKQRDGESNGKWLFTLALHDTSTLDARGRPVRSPALEESGLEAFVDYEEPDAADAEPPLTKREREAIAVLDKLREKYRRIGPPTVDQLRRALRREKWGPKGESAWRSAFKRLLDKLDIDSNDAIEQSP